MKSLIHLGAGCALAAALGACAPKERPAAEAEASQSAPVTAKKDRRIALVSAELLVPSGTILADERTLAIERARYQEDGGSGGESFGRMTGDWRAKKESTVRTRNLRWITITEDAGKIRFEPDQGQPEEVLPSNPLTGKKLDYDTGRVSLVESKPNAEQALRLRAFSPELLGDLRWFPPDPVEPHKAWEVKPADFYGALFDTPFTEASGHVSLRIQEVVQFDGQRCARVLVSAQTGRGKATFAGKDAEFEMRVVSGLLYRSLETSETVRVELNGDVRVTQKLAEGRRRVTDGQLRFLATRTIKKPS